MAITESIIGVIADIGVDAAKDHFKDKLFDAKAKERLSDYLTRQKEYNFNCSLEEEIDFEGLAEYIHSDLMDDVTIRLFGKQRERGIARERIADKATYYAKAKTKLSKERARHLAVTAVDILCDFFRSTIDKRVLFVSAEIEDTISDEMSERFKEHERKFDALAKNIQDNSTLSIDKNVSLANSGKLDEVEKNAAAFFAGLGTTHALAPYYGFTMDGVSCFKSIPLRPDAVELYPPRFEVTATELKMGGVLLTNMDTSTFTRAYQTQSLIEFDVATARKYLGNVLDPIQHEAERLAGTHMFLKPPPFPPAFPCSVYIDGEIAVDYLLLRTKRIEDDETIVITNEEQNNFKFGVVLKVNAATKSLNLFVTAKTLSNAEALRYRIFLKKAASAKQIELKLLEYNATLISSQTSLISHNYEDLDGEIEFLQKIVAIEEFFRVAFEIPENLELSDHQFINRLYSMITEGKYDGFCRKFAMPFEVTEDIKKAIYGMGETAYSLTYKMEESVELFNQKLVFQIIRMMDSVRIDNFENIRNKIAVLDEGDLLKISFVSGDANADIHYSDMFCSEKEDNPWKQSTSEKPNMNGGVQCGSKR